MRYGPESPGKIPEKRARGLAPDGEPTEKLLNAIARNVNPEYCFIVVVSSFQLLNSLQ